MTDDEYSCDRCGATITDLAEFHVCDLPDPCKVAVVSSRACGYGTRSCTLRHAPTTRANNETKETS